MTLDQALDPQTRVTLAEARREVLKHGGATVWFDFLTALGRRDTYSAREVLFWLGY